MAVVEVGALILWVLSLPKPHHANNQVLEAVWRHARVSPLHTLQPQGIVYTVTRFDGPKSVVTTRECHYFIPYHPRYSKPSLNNNA